MNYISETEIRQVTMANLLETIPPVSETTSCHQAAELFRQLDGVEGFAVVRLGKPIGIIARDHLTIRLATQFGHAVYGKRPVAEMMLRNPLVVDINDGIDQVEHLITDGFESALSAGFIVSQNGDYAGMGNVLALMRESVKRTRLQNQQLEISTQLAKHANEVKSQFLAGMSHELRTPLNAIIGFSELIVQEAFGPISPPKYKQYVEDILDGGRHLLTMISDILDMSKIEAGRYELNEQAVELHGIARHAVKMCSVLADNKGIKLDYDISNPSPVVLGDPRAIKQILLNLLSNGIKYTENEGHVSLRIVESINREIHVTVRDNGPGIPAKELTRITEPFVQVSSGHNNKTEGTGLGLAIVKALSDLHDAHFEISSEIGVGTTVSILFPSDRNYLQSAA
ncbi:sensor histidine kinase [Sneathiella limimaris]|uniref:sensor histidine kinase n=1 Tax=Sneathiella limimaris TaxID=1964213 RepID=UPI00146B9C30|nr:ATP-binding protein [Sneathiella limimaris]